jgi:class 3 adenylate cyclase
VIAAAAETGTVRGTVMFTDIVGFTEFNALRGDAEAVALLSLQERIVLEEIGADARIVKGLGDGLMLWFGDACAAIETGLRLQERFEEESARIDAPLWVRIGVHAGQQTRRGNDLLGHDVNVASRIMNLANSGEVLASEDTVKRARHLAGRRVRAAGPVVGWHPTPINLYRVERAAPPDRFPVQDTLTTGALLQLI